MSPYITLLLSSGGVAFLIATFNGIKSLSVSRLESEAALIQRLNDDTERARAEESRQRARAERAERYAELLSIDKNNARDLAATYRRMLIEHGVSLDDHMEE